MPEPTTDARLSRVETYVEQILEVQREQTAISRQMAELLANNQFMGQRVGRIEAIIGNLESSMQEIQIKMAEFGAHIKLAGAIGVVALGGIGSLVVWWVQTH